jgi:tRNA pseudouridine38-40 synthase
MRRPRMTLTPRTPASSQPATHLARTDPAGAEQTSPVPTGSESSAGADRAGRARAEAAGGSAAGGQALVRLRLDLAYDGSAFHGWARQPGLPTVQQAVEDALALVLALPEPPGLTVAGRTDAGVHARGQVAHVDVPAERWAAAAGAALRRLGGLLPPEVRVRAIGPAPDGFDARFSALWRRYSYRVCDDPAAADPLRRHDTLWHARPLSLDLMNEAARRCLGEHDFAAFCRRKENGTTVRELLTLAWARPEPGVAVATVAADAFCHNMVRALAGASLAVGEGSRPPGWLAEVLAARVRNPAVRVAPPHALCLEEVRYPDPADLASRALATRRVRPAPASAPGLARG